MFVYLNFYIVFISCIYFLHFFVYDIVHDVYWNMTVCINGICCFHRYTSRWCSKRTMSTNLIQSGALPSHVGPQLKDLVLVQVIRWYELGLQLGVDDTELEVIKRNNPGDLEACRREMFRAWLRITPSPSYQQLVEALVTVREVREADHLCKKYGK